MMIKAVLRNGAILPLEPLPPDWTEGKELAVEDPSVGGAEDIDAWARELEAAVRQLPAEEHDHFRRALEDIERRSKEAVRIEWGLT